MKWDWPGRVSEYFNKSSQRSSSPCSFAKSIARWTSPIRSIISVNACLLFPIRPSRNTISGIRSRSWHILYAYILLMVRVIYETEWWGSTISKLYEVLARRKSINRDVANSAYILTCSTKGPIRWTSNSYVSVSVPANPQSQIQAENLYAKEHPDKEKDNRTVLEAAALLV